MSGSGPLPAAKKKVLARPTKSIAIDSDSSGSSSGSSSSEESEMSSDAPDSPMLLETEPSKKKRSPAPARGAGTRKPLALDSDSSGGESESEASSDDSSETPMLLETDSSKKRRPAPARAPGAPKPLAVDMTKLANARLNDKKKVWGREKMAQHGRHAQVVEVRAARSYAHERDAQLLRHLAATFFFLIKDGTSDEKEVQAMSVNNRILVSANDQDSLAKLQKIANSDMLAAVDKLAARELGTRAKRSTGKLAAVLNSTRLGPRPKRRADEMDEEPAAPDDEALALATMLRAAVRDPAFIQTVDAKDATAWLSSPKYENRVLIVRGPSLHAELNLVLSLVNAAYKGRALVRGKKRPCVVCYLTMLFVQQKLKFTQLDFTPRPGNYWHTALPTLKGLLESHLRAVDGNGIKAKDLRAFAETFLAENFPKKSYKSAKPDSGDKRGRKRKRDEEVGVMDWDSGSDSELEAPTTTGPKKKKPKG